MIVQRYEDGSELTFGMLFGAIGFGALSAAAIILFKESLEGRRWRKYFKEIAKRNPDVLKK